MTASMPEPTSGFQDRKTKILDQLAVPDGDYTDASPKGSVDEGIRPLLEEINAASGFVTTSSCAGRVSVFLEGRKATTAASSASTDRTQQQPDINATTDGPGERLAGVGGKGGGGTWLYVSHEPHHRPTKMTDGVSSEGQEACMSESSNTIGNYWIDLFGLQDSVNSHDNCSASSLQGKSGSLIGQTRLIHFKFEPMILHVLTASPAHAQLLLRCALHAGFRESGAVSLIASSLPSSSSPHFTLNTTTDSPKTPMPTPMVAVRSMGLGFESLIGYEDVSGRKQLLVPPSYLDVLMEIANDRFRENTKRIQRFAEAFRDELKGPAPKLNPNGGEWEDAVARKARMRAEGLQRQAEKLKPKETTHLQP